MRVIVFDRELHEPLTVVEVPHWLADQAKAGRPVRLAPPLSLPTSYAAVVANEECSMMPVVTLTFEPVYRGRSREPIFWYAYADDPETALLLRAAFLHGQVGEVRRREKVAYIKGLFAFDE